MTLTLDRVILHTVMHRSSTSTYIPNFIEIKKTFCGRTYGWVDGHLRPTLLGRLGGVDLKTAPNAGAAWLANRTLVDDENTTINVHKCLTKK